MPDEALKASILELKSTVTTLNDSTVSLDKQIQVFIQKSEGESIQFRGFMERTHNIQCKLESDVHALQIWQAESRSGQDDLKEVKKVVVKWIAGGLIGSACGVMALIATYINVNSGGLG